MPQFTSRRERHRGRGHHGRRLRRRGFTLIELLVVVGIIAILISVLLPVLGSARRSAASVKCLSNLKNLHNALLMYAADYKNATPVARQDPWNPGTRVAATTAGQTRYWVDMLYPYVLKKPSPMISFTKEEATAYQASVLWCPTWYAEHPELDVFARPDPDRFRSGYSINIYFGFRPDFPKPDAMLKAKDHAIWSGIWNSGAEGRYYKRNEINQQAERMIIADSNMWLMGISVANGNPDLAPQIVDALYGPNPGENPNGKLEHNSGSPGATNYDRYRHGKSRPRIAGNNRFESTGGDVKYNVLFVDGHAATLNSIQDGYKAIRMRYP